MLPCEVEPSERACTNERYELHLFFAERHTTESTFAIETSVSDPILCE